MPSWFCDQFLLLTCLADHLSLLRLLTFMFAAIVAHVPTMTAEQSERGVVVKIDGQLFTEYLTKAGKSPAMWPIIGPTGKPMTRSYPVGPAGTGRNERSSAPSIAVVHARRSERQQFLVAKPQRSPTAARARMSSIASSSK